MIIIIIRLDHLDSSEHSIILNRKVSTAAKKHLSNKSSESCSGNTAMFVRLIENNKMSWKHRPPSIQYCQRIFLLGKEIKLDRTTRCIRQPSKFQTAVAWLQLLIR